MKQILLTAIFIMVSIICRSAESADTLTVADKNTHVGICCASVYIPKHTDGGTVANINGNFRLKNVNDGDSLIISSIGYKTLRTIYKKDSKTTVYNMEPYTYTLPEVIIYDIRKLLNDIWNKIADNSPRPYPVLDGIYRQQIAVDNKLALVGECDLLMKEPPFKKNSVVKTRIAYDNRRVYLNNKYPYAKNFTYAIEPAGYPGIYEINPKAFRYYNYFIDKTFRDDFGNTIIKIAFEKRDNTGNGYIYVNKSNLAIVKFHFVRMQADVENPKTNDIVKNIKYTWDTNYKKIENGYIHSYFRVEYEYYLSNSVTKKSSHKINAVIDYKTNNIVMNSNADFKKYEISPFYRIEDSEHCGIDELKGTVTDYNK